MSFCTKCGAKLQEGNAFCTKCGASVAEEIEDLKSSGIDVMVTEVVAAAEPDVSEQRTAAMSAYGAGSTKQIPTQSATEDHSAQVAEAGKPKSKKRLVVLIAVFLAVIAALVAVIVLVVVPGENNGDPAKSSLGAASTTDEAETVLFESDYFKIVLPEDIADKVSISESNDSVMIRGANDGPIIAVLYPQNQKLAGEYRYACYSLGDVYIGGHFEAAMMDVPYVDANNQTMHVANTAQGELAVSKLLGLTPEELANCISLSNGSRFVEAKAELISDMSTDKGLGSSANTASNQDANVDSKATGPFWGIWDGAYKDKKKADAEAAQIKKDSGYDAAVFLTTDWSNLNSESWYVISIGVYGTESEAKSAFASIKNAYPNAYVKYSGDKK